MEKLLKLTGIALVIILASVHIQSCTKPKPNSNSNSSTAPGTAMFWWNSVNFVSFPVVIAIQGDTATQSITQPYSVQPACSATGCAVFSLNPGTYNWSWVQHGVAEKTGVVTVTSNQCTATQVN